MMVILTPNVKVENDKVESKKVEYFSIRQGWV